MVMKEILHELREIRKELQAIRSSLGSSRRYVREPYGRKFIPLPEHGTNRSQQKES